MSNLLQCQDVSLQRGTQLLFRDLSLAVGSGDRMGLVGHNGSGKSTLLGLMAGDIEPDRGEITRRSDLVMTTVEQFMAPVYADLTLFECLLQRIPADERDYREYLAEKLLMDLGFSNAELQHRCGDLSGGQQNRLMFARAVIREPDLVLFDEPTNHLDVKTLLQFEDWLQKAAFAFVLVSHDRAFLDAVTDRTVILRDQTSYSFKAPFSDAREQLFAHDEAAAASRKAEERKLDSLRQSAKRLATWGKVYDSEKFARRARSMEKRIERLEDERTFVSRGSGLQLDLTVSTSRANRMLHSEHQDISFPGSDTPLFHIEDLFIRPGDRVALLGHNGVGKSTLIRQLVNAWEQADDSRFIFNPQCQLGYYDQELERLAPEQTLIEVMRSLCPGDAQHQINALIHAGFPFSAHHKPTAVLSGGERARLMFLVFSLCQPNFLILDEPTNHIDIEGKESLEEQLLAGEATLLVTSHDRRFVDNIATRYLLIDAGRLTEIHDPARFYDTVRSQQSQAPSADNPEARTDHYDEEGILQRIIELETLLSEDRARKTKFQKPARQQAWQAELDELNHRLR